MEGSKRLKKELSLSYTQEKEKNLKIMEKIKEDLHKIANIEKMLQIEHLELESRKRNSEQLNFKNVIPKEEEQFQETVDELETDPSLAIKNLMEIYQGNIYLDNQDLEQDSD